MERDEGTRGEAFASYSVVEVESDPMKKKKKNSWSRKILCLETSLSFEGENVLE